MDRDLRRIQRLLRRIDLEEVLAELDIEVLYYKGSDGYCECPHPDHDDAHPSFHVCIEDCDRLGWWNCWSHPGGLRSVNFLVLVARVREQIWERHPTAIEIRRANTWLRETFLVGDATKGLKVSASRRRRKELSNKHGRLIWPPLTRLDHAPDSFVRYLDRRGISPARAVELGVSAVLRPGPDLCRTLRYTTPAVCFPIRRHPTDENGENWYCRAIANVSREHKGRYCPGVLLGKVGLLWAPDGLDTRMPLVLVEGILDSERVRSVCNKHDLHFCVAAVLGGWLLPNQARRLRGFGVIIHLADGDQGGETLSSTIEQHLGGGNRKIVVHPMPDGRDPGDAPETRDRRRSQSS